MIPSFRNIPAFIWAADADTTCPSAAQRGLADRFETLSYRYQLWTFQGMNHTLLPTWQPQAEFMAAQRLIRNPSHITYVANATMSEPRLGLTADHAYWLSGVTVRDASGHPASAQSTSHRMALPSATRSRRPFHPVRR